MAGAGWPSTARTIADHDEFILSASSDGHRSVSPLWTRRSSTEACVRSSIVRSRSRRNGCLQSASKLIRRGLRAWSQLSPLQKAGFILLHILMLVLGLLFLVYNERIFKALAPAAKKWRELPAGWLILWFMTFFVSFPPLIGYSTCITIAGFVFGMKGWLIVASATVFGSTVSFIVSRTVLKTYVSRMAEKNKQFAALSLVLKHDGLKLLCMIRLCPLPYSVSNGAISTIPTVTWPNFMLATAIASPKLFLHVFIGSRLGDIAKNSDNMDSNTKAVSYASMAMGVVLGIVTGYIIYARTNARACVLEAEEAATEISSRRAGVVESDYVGDLDDTDATDILRARQSDISLHQTYEDAELLERGYRDDFTDDEDAQTPDVFDEGDGETDDEAVVDTKPIER